MKKIKLTVAIAAYNAGKNIKKLAQSILKQKAHSYTFQRLIVNSDASSDNTVIIASSIQDKRLKVVDTHKRSGFAGTVANLVKSTMSDVLLILNDDIVVKDPLFLEKMIQSFLTNKNVGLVCSNAQAMKSDSFISEAVRSGFNAFKKMGEHINAGNNVFTADGKTLCLSRRFMKTITFPKDKSEMANVDSFMYLTCMSNGFAYRYIKSSVFYFKPPSTIKDFIKWQIRSYKTNRYSMPRKFKNIAKEEYRMPRIRFQQYKFIEFLKNPFGSILILFLGLYCTYKASIDRNNFIKTWDLVQSTKDL